MAHFRQGPEGFPQKGHPSSEQFLKSSLRNYCSRQDPLPGLSGPLRLSAQSRSRTRLRIAASIAFLLRACFKGVLDAVAPLSRG